MKDLEKPYKIHKFWCKSDKYWVRYNGYSDVGSVFLVVSCELYQVSPGTVSKCPLGLYQVTVPQKNGEKF